MPISNDFTFVTVMTDNRCVFLNWRAGVTSVGILLFNKNFRVSCRLELDLEVIVKSLSVDPAFLQRVWSTL